MGEFKPTPQNAINIEETVLKVKKERASLVEQKSKIQLELSIIKNRMESEDMNAELTAGLFSRRSDLIQKQGIIDIQIKNLNIDIRKRNSMINRINTEIRSDKLSKKADDNIINDLSILKDKYKDFSKDHTRVSSMRIMASSFSDEIESIINKFS